MDPWAQLSSQVFPAIYREGNPLNIALPIVKEVGLCSRWDLVEMGRRLDHTHCRSYLLGYWGDKVQWLAWSRPSINANYFDLSGA